MLLSKSIYVGLLGVAIGCAVGIGGDRLYLAMPVATTTTGAVAPVAMLPPLVRTVDWYVAHPNDASAKVAACNNDPGNASSDAECLNAFTATEKIGFDMITHGSKR